MSTKGYYTSARLLVQGATFSPRSAEAGTGIVFSEKNEVGDLGKYGKYRDAPLPDGSATLELASSSTREFLDIDAPIFQTPGLVAALRSSGASMIVLYVDVAYEAQCNFELSPELLAALAELGVTVGFSCFPVEEQENQKKRTGP